MANSNDVVVTGVSTGIGWGTTKGFRVFGSLRKQADADRLQSEFGNGFVPLMMDITDADAVHQAAQKVGSMIGDGNLVGLVNNKGKYMNSTNALSPHGPAGGSTASETRFLAVEGGQIAYDDTGGNGPLILAIPGMGDLWPEYRLVRPELQGAGYRVVTMDVRGFGQTSARWADYSAHAVGRDALALIEHLKAGSAVILGNSFAAGSALWAAHDVPARVRGVVLLAPLCVT